MRLLPAWVTRILGEKLNRRGQSPSEMEEDRRNFADGLASASNGVAGGLSGSDIMGASFVAFPLQHLVAEEEHNDRLLEALLVIADDWFPALHKQMRAGWNKTIIEELINSGLGVIHQVATKLGCDRYANVATLYGACTGTGLGPPGVMVMKGAVRWDFVEEAERRAFDGGYRNEPWWPQ